MTRPWIEPRSPGPLANPYVLDAQLLHSTTSFCVCEWVCGCTHMGTCAHALLHKHLFVFFYHFLPFFPCEWLNICVETTGLSFNKIISVWLLLRITRKKVPCLLKICIWLNETCFLSSCGYVGTAGWMHHLDSIENILTKTRLKLHKNATCCFLINPGSSIKENSCCTIAYISSSKRFK